MPLEDLAGVVMGAIARNESTRRADPDWRRLLALLAAVARETTHGKVLAVKTRPGLVVPGVAAADLEHELVTMSGYLWACDPSMPVAEQKPLITPATQEEIGRALEAYGILMHELGHILCSLLTMLRALAAAGLDREYRLLEEARMEASMAVKQPWYRGCFGYVFAGHRLPALAEAVGDGELLPLVDIALRALGADHAQLLHPTVVRACRDALEPALRPRVFAALDELARDVVIVKDADEAGMRACCERLRDLLTDAGASGRDDQDDAVGMPTASTPAETTPPDAEPSTQAGASTADTDRQDVVGPTIDLIALVATVGEAQSVLEPGEWEPIGDALAHVEDTRARVEIRRAVRAGDGDPSRSSRRAVLAGAGLPGVPFDPVAGWRQPTAEEQAVAREVHRRIAAVPALRDERLQTRYPPGRIDFTELVRRDAQLARGLAPNAEPFGRVEPVRGLLRDPLVVVLVDSSGSMGHWIDLAVGMGWAIAQGARSLRGRVAVVSFGNQATGLIDPARPPSRVPIMYAAGGTAHISEAFLVGAARLNLLDTAATRILAVVSDGDWHYNAHDHAVLSPYLRSGMRAMTVCAGAEPMNALGTGVRVDKPTELGDALATVLIDAVLADRGQRRGASRRRLTAQR
ncbi:vWA domain-containing protein [Conexibacter sp. JD483]|uniref:vWA domain-containing protein n=1 Tax=unclassified Conexibacter TaxID=2627773 RepID=UPI00271C44BE|nr:MULTISPECIES: vWA domain-containing protein [unclassified Conexibacter]MDO8185821.1 vWA domain-containing protein [Conexibacter sp. CPCC 205706]MDO8198565.1 vWA domain-containing protein [Conexibacter sp. CPCC 205762]MDR9367651.1 vWA domain-containing protein [Conexibacter sp. JD483]